jgi:hypothetical protein
MPIRIDNNVKNQKTTPALYSDIYANIPAYGQTGRLFFATDTNVIYRDTGSAWVVFLQSASVPSGLTPIGTAGQLIKVNAGATALEYFTGNFATANTVINNVPYLSATNTFANSTIYGYSNRIGLGVNPASAGSQVSVGITVANQNALDVQLTGTGYGIVVTHTGTGDPLYIGNGSAQLLNLNTSGVLYNVGKIRTGATPGTTYQLEVDGGINVATGHNYRKNGVVIFNSTTNTLPKYDATTGTFTNSNITDSGLVVQWNVQTGIGPLSSAGVSLDVNSAISFTTNYVGIKSATIIASTATSVSYFQSVGSNTTGGTITSLNHYSATQGTYGVAVTNQYGFIANSTLIGATKNYGFYSDLALSGTARYNFYANGTAPNYFAGTTNFGITGGTLISSQVAIYNSLNIQNNDFAGGSTGSYATFALSATSGNGLILDIESKSSGGTQSSVIRFNKQGTGNVIIGTIASPAYTLQLQTDSAGKPSTSTWTIVSDERVKTKIKSYNKGLNEILAINCIEYMYNGKGGFDKTKGGVGIIAQEIKDIVPECVDTYMGQLNPKDDELTEMYNFNSHAITFILINAIKELNSKIEALKTN